MSNKTSLITGIGGMDGSYMAELLLSKGEEVHGIIRRSSSFNTERIDHIFNKLHLHYGDLSDGGSLTNIINEVRPDYLYNFSAQSHVRVSFDTPEYTSNIDALGVTRILEAIRNNGLLRYKTKTYHASSSELFGSSPAPQNESTPLNPQSPYACSKLYAHHMCVNYRTAYNMFISSSILFNHSSPRRGGTFVTKKITKFITDFLSGKEKILFLGNLYAKRDWGFSPEYVKAIYDIMQLEKPVDLVIGTGESYTVKDFLNTAFNYIGMPLKWEGEGLKETGYTYGSKPTIKIDSRYFRPNEVDFLLADCSKAKEILNWEPKVKFNDIVKIMVDYDLMKEGLPPIGEGVNIINKNNFNWSIIR